MTEKVKSIIGCYFLFPDFSSRGHPEDRTWTTLVIITLIAVWACISRIGDHLLGWNHIAHLIIALLFEHLIIHVIIPVDHVTTVVHYLDWGKKLYRINNYAPHFGKSFNAPYPSSKPNRYRRERSSGSPRTSPSEFISMIQNDFRSLGRFYRVSITVGKISQKLPWLPSAPRKIFEILL